MPKQYRMKPTRYWSTAFLLALSTATLVACGPDDSISGDKTGTGNPSGTSGGTTGGDTSTAGTNSGATNGGTSGTGIVPGIDCEGVCGVVVSKPPAGTGQTYVPASTVVVTQCFRGIISGTTEGPLVKIKHSTTSSPQGDIVTALVVFSRDFTDNTYGVNAIGWSHRRGHTFSDVHKSDHAELSLLDGAGKTVIQAKIDLLSISASDSSGYASLGTSGGDGLLTLGNPADIVSTGTSMDDNFNRYGYVLLVDSPDTDSAYTVNPAYPYWNYYAVYRISVKASAFGAAGFGKALMTTVHASPAKLATSTIEVKEGACPTGSDYDPFPPKGGSTGTGTRTGTGTGDTTGTGNNT